MEKIHQKKEEKTKYQPQTAKDTLNLPLNIVTLFDIPINSGSSKELLTILTCLASGSNNFNEKLEVARPPASSIAGEVGRGRKKLDPVIVFTPNPEFIVKAQKEPEFKKILQSADINLPDGVGLVWAGKVLGEPINERISGADMVEKLLEIGNQNLEFRIKNLEKEEGDNEKWRIGVVGARRGVQDEVEDLLNRLQEKYPNINFVNLDKSSNVIARSDVNRTVAIPTELQNPNGIASSQAPRNDIFFNIVFATQGMQKQEKWILDNKNRINAGIFMGVGGSLDFITGFTKRAPAVWRKMGFEWLWRGLQKPGHFKRVWNAVFVFGFLVIKELMD